MNEYKMNKFFVNYILEKARREDEKFYREEEEKEGRLNHHSSLQSRKDTNLPPWSAAVFRGKILSF